MRHAFTGMLLLAAMTNLSWGADQPVDRTVSFHKEIRPIFQAHCQGCHQPAKRGGDYLMTSHEALLQTGESGEASIVPGKPDESYLIQQITPHEGSAEMPKGAKPLSEVEINLVRLWIEQGANDDSPASDRQEFNADHPPVYTRAPLITSLAFSPDGSLLAVSGFHEVILRSGDGQREVGRLIGLSERIESVAFSPDGSRLAVAGGMAGRSGELQIWSIADQELELSIPVTFDTIYGASWSPDGTLVAVGCGDATVRAFNSTTGEQVFFNGAHDDWALETVFSQDGSMLVSVGRDMSTKLYNVPTQRFIDNVTSITPGALKGGLSALARHPSRDEVLIGGSDGTPRIYRIERVTTRVIGDDANLIRQFPSMQGRIVGVAYAPDGKTIAAASSLNGQGQLFTYSSDVPFEMPEDIKAIVQKVSTTQNADEQKRLHDYVTGDVAVLTQTALPTAIFTLAYHPDGKTIATAGADGLIRLINAQDGSVAQEFLPVTLEQNAEPEFRKLISILERSLPLAGEESLPAETQIASLEVEPAQVQLHGPYDYVQLLISGVTTQGERIDVTRLANVELNGNAAEVSPLGRIAAVADGSGILTVSLQGQTASIPVSVSDTGSDEVLNFVRDVNPVFSQLGCNQGTCHGAQDGKNGFKLSLRGYDPLFDIRAFTDDIKSRRTNVASPDDSLILLKASGGVPHVGGQLAKPGDPYYEILRRWVAEGCQLDMDVERVASIEIFPHNPIVQQIGARQQLRVIATYTNGKTRDVTAEAFLESGNTEVAEANQARVLTAIRRGEAPILARYEGCYAATTLTVMGDRSGFAWEEPEIWSEIDRLVADKWERMKVLPSPLSTDEEFLRRVYLDLTGLPPTADQVLAFLNDERPTREKRDEVIDQLIGSDAYIEYWTNKWADLLQVNGKYLGAEGAKGYRNWIRTQVADNVPYDEFSRQVITATGSNKEHPAASYYKILREPDALMENTTHLFLGIRFNCNKCHDHPFERWTQDQYFETAAYFAQVGLQRDPQNQDGNIGGSAVEEQKPLWEEIFNKGEGEITHDRTGLVVAPLVPYNREIPVTDNTDRRQQLAEWITSKENDYFARSYVNRVWGYMMGVGLIEPLDDIRAGNPPTNPELLDWLTEKFIESDFDIRQLIATICKSRAYQLSVATNEWNADDKQNYSHALPKRLPAEVLYDAVYTVTGSKMQIPGVPEGTRAAALPDIAINLEDGFLDSLGRPVRESSCECERATGLQLGPVMALMNGATVNTALSQDGNALHQLVNAEADNAKLINQLFLRILNREAEASEIAAASELMTALEPQHEALLREIQDYTQKIAPQVAEKEAERQARIAQARAEMSAYEEEIRPRVEAESKARDERIGAAQKELEQLQARHSERFEEWKAKGKESQTQWTVLEMERLRTTTEAVLTSQPDLSILVSGENGKTVEYQCIAQIDLETITGIRLEALPDDSLPKKGPGRSTDGNFVLTEFKAEAWTRGKHDEKFEVKLQNAQADFSQNNYPIERAIDGDETQFNGWAIAPQFAKRIATFELTEPVTVAPKAMMRFRLKHTFTGGNHTLGRFRISVTDQQGSLDFGLPAEILEIFAVSVSDRTEDQNKILETYFNENDPVLIEKRKALQTAEQPLPVDPRLEELKKNVAEMEQPLPEDPHLARLKRAVGISEEQLKSQRLTAVQDIAWALINSPAFLFNR